MTKYEGRTSRCCVSLTNQASCMHAFNVLLSRLSGFTILRLAVLQEWEGPEVGTPDEVSQSLEDMMLQRFPELQALLVQPSFTNKSAPWRPIKSGHTSHAGGRATSLGVSREASFTHSR